MNSVNLIDTDIINLDNFVIYDADGNSATTNDQIIIKSGNIHLTSDVYLDMKIEEYSLKEFTLKNTTSDSVNFRVDLTFNKINLEVQNTIKKIPLPSFRLGWLPTTPPLPIIVKPNLEIIAGVVGNVSVTSDAGLTQNATLTLGLSYNRGVWAPISDFTNNFNCQTPTISGFNSLKAYIGTNLNMLLYGVAGPYGNLNTYLKLDSSLNSLNLHGGLEGRLGIKGEIFSIKIANYSAKVLDYEQSLYSWEKGVSKYKILFSSGPEFVVTPSDYAQIYTINTDGSNLKKLTNFTTFFSDYQPSWSPDGTKIAYVSNQDGNKEIYTMNSDGSNQTRLTYNTVDDLSPDWSPDGTKIVFVTDRDNPYYHEIWMMDANGSNALKIANTPNISDKPRWSPEGNRIIFSSYDGLYIVYKNGSNLQRIIGTNSSDFSPSWSPDGGKILFSSTRDGNYEVYAMDANGSNKRNLTNNTAVDAYPSWSSDGSSIVFVSDRGRYMQLHTMNSDGSGVQKITTMQYSNDNSPRFSPVPIQ